MATAKSGGIYPGAGGSLAAGGGPYVKPPNLESEYPSPTMVSFSPIKKAPYKYVDPMKFAQEWGTFNRAEILKNFDLAKQIGLEELDTELAGISKYAPAAAALKQRQTAADNIFNQQQRTAQFDTAMPGVRGQLEAQGKQAAQLAKGEIPDFLSNAQDRALELGIRSRAADNTMAGGFGAGSSVARKASDLMSADVRRQMEIQDYQLGMQQINFGNQLLGQNIQNKAALYMAPTEYSNAGTEMRVMPEVGAGRLTSQALTETNQLAMIQPTTALTSTIQQNQFDTSLEQQTRQFNASGLAAASSANAGIANQFALDKFGYQVGYAGIAAGVDTSNNLNAQGLQQQAQAAQIFQDYAQQAQQAQQTGAIAQGTGTIAAASQLVNGLAGLFGSSSVPTSSGGASFPSGQLGEGLDLGQVYQGAGTSGGGGGGGGFDYASSGGGGGVSGGGGDFTSNYPDTTLSSNLDYGSSIEESGDSGYLFKQATGLQYTPSFNNNSNATLRMAGLAKDATAIPNSINIGTDYNGSKVYSDAKSLTVADPTVGQQMSKTLTQILAPLADFNEEDLTKLNNISEKAGDVKVLASLDNEAANGNAIGFVNTILDNTGKGSVTDVAKDINGAATAYTAYQAMQIWPQLSNGQKSTLVGAMGLKATDFGKGKTLAEKVVPATVKPGTQPVTIAKTLDWFSRGINAYPLTRKWDQYNTIAKVVAGRNDPDTVAAISKQFNLLGAGINGAEVPGVTVQSLQKSGWAPTPHLGVGAIGAKAGALTPKGYIKIADDGQRIVAAPAGTAYTAKGALMKSTARNNNIVTTPNAAAGPFRIADSSSNEVVQGAQNILNWGAGAYNIYGLWHGGSPTRASLGTANTVGNAIDAYNKTQGVQSNYGEMTGSAARLYQAYEAARKGNYTQGAAFGTEGAFRGMSAYARSQGDEVAAAQYGKYAGYANAGINFYGAYNAWEHGDKVGAGVQATGGVAELSGLGGAGLLAGGAYTGYKAWGSGDIKQGALGGSMMLAGSAMMLGGPLGWAVGGGLLAAAVLGSSFTSGTTNKEHQGRNSFGDYLQSKTGLLDDGGSLTLADGTIWKIGEENDRHQAAHPELLTEMNAAGGKDDRSRDGFRAYDCDYTNDLDFTSTMAGQTLTRLLAGGSNTAIDQTGVSIGNAGIANIGYGQDMTRENFNKMAANQRAFYARAGIGSKNDGYQLANAAFAEGRIDELQHTQAIQSLDIIFDDAGYDVAQKLMAGRTKGVEAVQSMTTPAEGPISSTGRAKSNVTRLSKDEIRQLNASRYQPQAMAA